MSTNMCISMEMYQAQIIPMLILIGAVQIEITDSYHGFGTIKSEGKTLFGKIPNKNGNLIDFFIRAYYNENNGNIEFRVNINSFNFYRPTLESIVRQISLILNYNKIG